ncbi:hypothetical protein [Nocardioides alcanivorans]|nr:hypothetical protein [Nocardioides alcanivorans]
MAEVEQVGAAWRWWCGPCLEHSPLLYASAAEAASQADNHDGQSWHG